MNSKKMYECDNCFQKQRADFWHKVSVLLSAIIGGAVGGTIGGLCVRLLCK